MCERVCMRFCKHLLSSGVNEIGSEFIFYFISSRFCLDDADAPDRNKRIPHFLEVWRKLTEDHINSMACFIVCADSHVKHDSIIFLQLFRFLQKFQRLLLSRFAQQLHATDKVYSGSPSDKTAVNVNANDCNHFKQSILRKLMDCKVYWSACYRNRWIKVHSWETHDTGTRNCWTILTFIEST